MQFYALLNSSCCIKTLDCFDALFCNLIAYIWFACPYAICGLVSGSALWIQFANVVDFFVSAVISGLLTLYLTSYSVCRFVHYATCCAICRPFNAICELEFALCKFVKSVDICVSSVDFSEHFVDILVPFVRVYLPIVGILPCVKFCRQFVDFMCHLWTSCYLWTFCHL